MANITEGSALLQYHLELGRSGMEDGPLSTLSIPERRERLRAYDDAWKHLRWSDCIELPTFGEHTYDMDISPGGILTFVSKSGHKIIFVQIPSNLRGIPMRQWELSFSFVPHQYALDPSEDILVVFEWHRLVALDHIIPLNRSSLRDIIIEKIAFTFCLSPLGNPILELPSLSSLNLTTLCVLWTGKTLNSVWRKTTSPSWIRCMNSVYAIGKPAK